MKWFRLILCWALVSSPAAFGPDSCAADAETNSAADQVQNLPPPMPVSKSPVAVFRELLAMSAEEQRLSLSNRPPETRKLILAKVRAYQSLKPDVRELRLQATELRWYLMPLLQTPPTNRPAQLALIPTNFQHLIVKRLELWDKIPTPDQELLLKSEAILRYMTEVSEQTGPKEELSEKRRQLLEAGVSQWQAMSEQQKEQAKGRFNQFFGLSAEEKDKALNTLSEAEREQIEKTLSSYAKLSPAERAHCIRSFEKFAGLTLQERQQFLKNAERWKLMSPAERQSWRELVNRLQQQPPLPPASDLPPPPPGAVRPPKGHLARTNGG